jgi:23S rRNA G2445 N2-methylase RlmL
MANAFPRSNRSKTDLGMAAKPLTLELYGPPGALPEVALEAERIVANPWKPHKFAANIIAGRGFVRVRNASWELACELASRLSTVHDVRLMLIDTRVQHWHDLELALKRSTWTDVLPDGVNLSLHAKAGPGTCPHAGHLEESAQKFFESRGYTVIEDEPGIRVDLETFADHFRVRVSLGNDALHKRGWRAVTGTLATLREDIASAALVRLEAFEPRALQAGQISVPFAGSGTLGIETWHALCGLPPAVWDAERPWQYLLEPKEATVSWWRKRTLRAALEAKLPAIKFVERDARQAEELTANMVFAQAKLEEYGLVFPDVELIEEDVFKLPNEEMAPAGQITLLPLHPPYGLRLGSQDEAITIYSRLGRSVQAWGENATRAKTQVDGGALIGFCLCGDEASWRAFMGGIKTARTETSHITQGGLDVRVVCFEFSTT